MTAETSQQLARCLHLIQLIRCLNLPCQAEKGDAGIKCFNKAVPVSMYALNICVYRIYTWIWMWYIYIYLYIYIYIYVIFLYIHDYMWYIFNHFGVEIYHIHNPRHTCNKDHPSFSVGHHHPCPFRGRCPFSSSSKLHLFPAATPQGKSWRIFQRGDLGNFGNFGSL